MSSEDKNLPYEILTLSHFGFKYCSVQGEKGRTCKKYKILIGSRVFFFHFIHDLPFSPGHLLESEERFVNLFCNFSPLCGAQHQKDLNWWNGSISWTHRIQNTSKNPNLYPHQSRITYHSLLWDTLYNCTFNKISLNIYNKLEVIQWFHTVSLQDFCSFSITLVYSIYLEDFFSWNHSIHF